MKDTFDQFAEVLARMHEDARAVQERHAAEKRAQERNVDGGNRKIYSTHKLPMIRRARKSCAMCPNLIEHGKGYATKGRNLYICCSKACLSRLKKLSPSNLK